SRGSLVRGLQLERGQLSRRGDEPPHEPAADVPEPEHRSEGHGDRRGPEVPEEVRDQAGCDDEDGADPHVEPRLRLMLTDLREVARGDLRRVEASPTGTLDDVAEIRLVGLSALAPDGDWNSQATLQTIVVPGTTRGGLPRPSAPLRFSALARGRRRCRRTATRCSFVDRLLRGLLVARVLPANRLAPLPLGPDVADDAAHEDENADDDNRRHPRRRARGGARPGKEGRVLVAQVVEAVARVLEPVHPEDDERGVQGAEQPREPHPRSRQSDRTWPVRAVSAQEQDSGERDHVREHVPEVARREDEVDVLEVEEQ